MSHRSPDIAHAAAHAPTHERVHAQDNTPESAAAELAQDVLAPYRRPACQLCQCALCVAERGEPSARKRPRLRARIVLVVLAAIVAPIVSLVANAAIGVVELGMFGTLAAIGTIVSALLHLLLAPRRIDESTLELVSHAPGATVTRLLLLASAGLSCALWGYIALLFLPILPISILLIVYLGLGLAGLSPYTTLSVHIPQLVRAYVAVRARIGRARAICALVAALVALPCGLGGVALLRNARHAALRQSVAAIAAAPALSVRRTAAIAALAGREDALVELYLRDATRHSDQLGTIAEAYHRLTDTTINAAVTARRPRRRNSTVLRPFAFLDGYGPFYAHHFFRF